MSKTTTMSVDIRFGDCDPAGIVFFPNFHRWMDAASLHFFMSCGVPPWNVLEHRSGIIGTPLLEHHARFAKTATFGDQLQISSSIIEWRPKVFLQKHVVMRGADLICESTETRVFCRRDADDPRRIRAVPVPEDIRRLCD
ncbi:MAG: acyl-CoA thioesterase [Burkholderiales bacterium]|nr:acyl-CoA thioesterase [Burkholderiales bacterium]MDE2395919.1 acyl-CoA thioesterase [Burkholderiales bacterium]MDE2453245.1 acyl-CoA thioesterase [Burkholderiales bacterium]